MAERAVYVSCADDRAIHVLAMDEASGALRARAVVEVPGPPGPATSMPLAFSVDRRFLYAAIRLPPYPVSCFVVDPPGGIPVLRGTAELPEAMAYIACAGGHLLGASYPGALLSSSPSGAGGVPGVACDVVRTSPKAHSILPDPAGRFIYAAVLGGDEILIFTLDAQGRLQPAGRAEIRPGAGPRHLRFAPGGRFLYAVNESDATIDAWRVNTATGALSLEQTVAMLPPGTEGRIAAADIQITPDGRFLYASERLTNILFGCRVDAATGRLEPIGAVPAEAAPRGFAIDPNGRFLLCAGQSTGRVAAYAIDGQGGRLTRIGEHPVGANPNWVEFAPAASSG
ncbi:MAG TPA: lactonase family protein [Acetobacteraceae bacterium]